MLHSQLLQWLLLSISRSCLATAQPSIEQALTELRPLLSPSALITLPNTPHFTELQIRASSPRISPSYSAVVEVATEEDVTAVVKVANRYDISFLAISGAHSWTRTLNTMEGGIQINMRRLNTTVLASDGETARVGGGTLQYEITRALFGEGKYAVTGLSECVSVAGPLLGGGHSLLQNQHGYALDSLVSARVVTASSKLIEVSKEKNADLFWALRGAGHNFGIVTSVALKVYDVPSNWTVYTFVYASNKLEALFDLIHGFEMPGAHRSTKLALTGVFIKLPDVDPINPVILYNIIYEGPSADAEPYAAPFKALGPASTTIDNVDYVNLYRVTANDLNSRPCIRNRNILGAGVSLPAWDLAGIRKAFNIFGNVTADPRFETSITLLENYGMTSVRAVDSGITALPPLEREYPILASPVLWWDGDRQEDERDAHAFASAMKTALYTGIDQSSSDKRHCYVNYASGEESRPEMYGYEEWRLAKLERLKRIWDPKNRFGFYNPIAS